MSEQVTNPGSMDPTPINEPACAEVVEINCFAYTAEGFSGHVKISGVPMAKAVKRLGELSTALTNAGMTPREGHSEARGLFQGINPACPEHGAAKVKPSQYGSGYYCTKRLEDGSYCKWKSP